MESKKHNSESKIRRSLTGMVEKSRKTRKLAEFKRFSTLGIVINENEHEKTSCSSVRFFLRQLQG